MKRLGSILRSFFVSLEFLVSLGGLAVFWFYPAQLAWLSNRIGSQAEVLKYAGFLAAGLLVYDAKVVRSILLPDADKRTVLQGWDFYWNLKCGAVTGLIYGALFALAGVVALLFDWKAPEAYQSAFLLTGVIGGFTVSGSLYFANIRIEELFRQHWKQAPAKE